MEFMGEVGECYAGVDCVMDEGGFDGVRSDDGTSARYAEKMTLTPNYDSYGNTAETPRSSSGGRINLPARLLQESWLLL